MSVPALYCGARPADAEDLRALALLSYGHFTAMRVRDGAVQGLDLHLARLRDGHAALFDAVLDEPALRNDLRAVLAGQGDASVRITGFARDFDYRDPLKVVQPEWLISVGTAAPAAGAAPMALKSFSFVRPLPQIKHVAMLPLFHYRREARRAGCDDALFVAGALPASPVIEGSVWNIGFWDGAVVHWPEGPALRGTCEGLLQRGFEALGVPQRTGMVNLERARTLSAFTANANGCGSVASIDGVSLPRAPALQGLLDQALATQAWVRI
ncbi:aminotransferase class IV [Pseudoxanthomonas sp.]|uniref:aminotransferase class IV n=1 Tax=Pseudoxanthomonas sp. TaxID=1871049 RepID=UPI00262486D8|nr:aminotransferase class IV [Pseudoxanthomonas sp.]WDS36394.1 MAG: aminotransferase class IV [Pseudoxanthomonas sp.]